MKDSDYEAIYLKDGKISYVFNAGSGPVTITSDDAYNDGKWHKVSQSRTKAACKASYFRLIFVLDFLFDFSVLYLFLFVTFHLLSTSLY